MEGEESFKKYSPEVMIRNKSAKKAISLLPPIILFHGTDDLSIPSDARNFPQGTITDMVDDVSRGISLVCNNIFDHGGDPIRIYLMGQSAGAHISACALFQQAMRESHGESNSWSVSQIKAYFGLSGGSSLASVDSSSFKITSIGRGRPLFHSSQIFPSFQVSTGASGTRKDPSSSNLDIYRKDRSSNNTDNSGKK